MDTKQAEHHCEFGAFFAFAWAFFSALFITIDLFLDTSKGNELFISIQQYALAVLVLMLGIGLMYYSRLAGVFLSALTIAYMLYNVFILGHITSVIMGAILLYFFIRATWGAFSYHSSLERLDK